MSKAIHNFIDEADEIYSGGRVGVLHHVSPSVSRALSNLDGEFIARQRSIEAAFAAARQGGVGVQEAVAQRDEAIDDLLREHGAALRAVCPQADALVDGFRAAYEEAYAEHGQAVRKGVATELADARLNALLGAAVVQFKTQRQALAG